MTVQLYKGCWGVTGGGEKRGPIGRNFRTWAATHHWRCDTNTWTANGAWDASGSLGSPDDIIAVFATEAEAYLAGETAEASTAPKPVTWPDGVTKMTIGPHQITIDAETGVIQVVWHGSVGSTPAQARQLAALLLAAADKVEGRG